MAYRNGNYVAFHVDDSYESTAPLDTLRDYCYYSQIKKWKSQYAGFPFVDSHDKNYNVRDTSDWETTLKPRLHGRLNNSKNIILILSSHTSPSKALDEEMRFGIEVLRLPVIVAYPDFSPCGVGAFDYRIKGLWDRLPSFGSRMDMVPTVHVSFDVVCLRRALENGGYMVQSAYPPGKYLLP